MIGSSSVQATTDTSLYNPLQKDLQAHNDEATSALDSVKENLNLLKAMSDASWLHSRQPYRIHYILRSIPC